MAIGVQHSLRAATGLLWADAQILGSMPLHLYLAKLIDSGAILKAFLAS
jgi:hypothetical protein